MHSNTEPSEDIIDKLLNKYPNRVPIKVTVDKNINQIGTTQFLVPKNYTVAKFMMIVRSKINITKDQALFLLINNELPPSSDLISNIYSKYNTSTGKRYIDAYLKLENTFG